MGGWGWGWGWGWGDGGVGWGWGGVGRVGGREGCWRVYSRRRSPRPTENRQQLPSVVVLLPASSWWRYSNRRGQSRLLSQLPTKLIPLPASGWGRYSSRDPRPPRHMQQRPSATGQPVAFPPAAGQSSVHRPAIRPCRPAAKPRQEASKVQVAALACVAERRQGLANMLRVPRGRRRCRREGDALDRCGTCVGRRTECSAGRGGQRPESRTRR